MCRREGVSLCGKDNCAQKRRPYPPGVHGPTSRTRMTDYGKQLREKQKAKRIYGVSEKQFNNYYQKAMKMKGDSGENLVRLLEMRLDNTVFRAGMAKTRAAARQAVSHAHIEVNGKRVDVASYQVKTGDIIKVRETKKEKSTWKALVEATQKAEVPSWVILDTGNLEAKVTGQPSNEELQQSLFSSKLIIEFYSR